MSYARFDPDAAPPPDQSPEQLFEDLRINLGELLALPTGSEIGFMDTSMRGGTDWPPELMNGLGTCQVMIALLSPRYLNSLWCGMEWDAFSQRRPRRRPGAKVRVANHQGCVIPVWWAPVQRPLPSLVKEDMIFAPTSTPIANLPELYRENGIFGLMRMGRDDCYQTTVWQLSMLIARVYGALHLPHRAFRPDDLGNGFEGASP